MVNLLKSKIQAIIDSVEGGVPKCIQTLLDEAIDDGWLTQKEYQENEIAILAMIDDSIFTCNICDWTIPIEEMSEVNDDWRCRDCD